MVKFLIFLLTAAFAEDFNYEGQQGTQIHEDFIDKIAGRVARKLSDPVVGRSLGGCRKTGAKCDGWAENCCSKKCGGVRSNAQQHAKCC